jgi:[ribosomal protein S5]-alanine N-acetyltransferase
MFPVRLELERLVLREWQETDWLAAHEYARDPEVVKYETWGPNSVEQTRDFVRRSIEASRSEPRTVFELAVTERANGALIGGCGIRVRDSIHREGDLGYTLGAGWWGRGLGTETARALVRFGFDRLGLHRIWATCHVENRASARVLEKAGMRLEGTLRKHRLQRGEWRDSFLYAVLETD